MMQETTEKTIVTPINGMSDMATGINEVIAAATNRIAIFDRDLAEGGYNTAERFNRF